ncbi:MAG: branched-chain amino acid ABC transporter permease [Rhodospirillales bacterium]|nr:branched-chain amino acid ABC transporter permease [Rhodospirillales bacterium]MDH3910886.1 branched-chain amino acid ABC transporter permease [Rhodospirillales bacterium]
MAGLARRSGIWLAALGVVLVLPWIFSSGFAITTLNQMGVLIIFSLAYNMLLGQGGMLSFGHAVYFGLAGYSVAHVLNGIGAGTLPYVPVSLLPLVGGLVGLLFGIPIGFVSTRRAGTVFAMISLGFAEMMTALTLILVVFFNGEEGVQTDRWAGPEPFGITYGPDVQVYYLIAAWCLLATLAMYALTRTPFGRMTNAVRDNPERVQFVGYSTHRVRWLAFVLSSFFAGMAGALHALNVEHVGFETVGVGQSGLVLFMVWIGGARAFIGPIFGAVVIAFLNSNLSGITEAWLLYLGIIFMTVVMFAQGGLSGLILMHEPIWKTDLKLFRPMVLPYAAGIGATIVACLGAIGLIELIYFMSTKSTRDTGTSLYTVPVDAATALPWLVCAGVAALGAAACRRAYRPMAASYADAIETVKAGAAR